MYACCDGGRLDNIQTLIQNGADIKAHDNDGSTLLHFASRNSKPEILEFLLSFNELSVNAMNKDNKTPLMNACFEGGRLDKFQMLIKNGANINSLDSSGATLLHIVSCHAHNEVLDFLFKLNELSVMRPIITIERLLCMHAVMEVA